MPAGRPKKEIKYDAQLVTELAAIFCTMEEIANIMGIAIRTFQYNDELMRAFKDGREHAKKSLRKKQFDVAMGGNVTMLLWLGKQYLGQREPTQDTTIPTDEIDDDMNDYDE